MSIMDSNHNIECGICGYRFKTLSKIEEHYHDYDLCEELVYYPDPKDSNPPHLVKNWICDKCFRRIGDAVKDNMIKDANDFVNDLNTRIEAIEREYKAKIDKEKEETEKVNNCIKELEGLKNLSDMSEDLHDTIERMPYFVFKSYYLDVAIGLDLERKQNKYKIISWCQKYGFKISKLAEGYTDYDYVDLETFLSIVENSVISSLTYKDLQNKISDIKKTLAESK